MVAWHTHNWKKKRASKNCWNVRKGKKSEKLLYTIWTRSNNNSSGGRSTNKTTALYGVDINLITFFFLRRALGRKVYVHRTTPRMNSGQTWSKLVIYFDACYFLWHSFYSQNNKSAVSVCMRPSIPIFYGKIESFWCASPRKIPFLHV